jgi:hypothetical protein
MTTYFRFIRMNFIYKLKLRINGYRPGVWIFLNIYLVLSFFNRDFAQQNVSSYSVLSDTFSVAEITAEEQLMYQSDFIPLSLAERGRQSALAWRGMPPGFLDYQFKDIRIIHPLWGFWDNQLLPVDLIKKRQVDFNNLAYKFEPSWPTSQKTVSKIAYSQDFVFGLSYLDVELIRYYRQNSYFRLGGKNFLRNGSAPEFTSIQVNSYRFQLHHQLSERWNLDLWYLQFRHKFGLGEYPFFDFSRKNHRIGQIFFLGMNFSPNNGKQIKFIPYAYKWGDRYYTSNYSEQRRTELYSVGFKLMADLDYSWGSINFIGDGLEHRITESIHLNLENQTEGLIKLGFNPRFDRFWIKAGGGYKFLQNIGKKQIYHIDFGWKGKDSLEFVLQGVRTAGSLPLLALFWKNNSVSSLSHPRIPVKKGITYWAKFPLLKNVTMKVEPFYHKFEGAWGFDKIINSFVQYNIENAGISTKIRIDNSYYNLNNQFTFNHNYRKSFVPQYNNVVILNIPLALFGHALKLNGFMIYHYFGKWRTLNFSPMVNQYTPTNIETGYYHILDFKLLAHIKTATLFFIWENSTSQDYEFIQNYTEFFRIFRFGIYWTLFD